MTQTLDAVFQNGVFRPINAPNSDFVEGQQVRLRVETEETNEVLELAGAVYDGLSEEDQAEIERLALDRSRFWSQSL